MNWGMLLDELKQKEAVDSDAKIAAALGVSRGYICAIRKGRKRMSLGLAREVVSRLGRKFDVEKFELMFVPGKVRSYTRNLLVTRQFLVERACGLCELCGNPAPFSDANGAPYLEMHQLISHRDGGSDTLDNVVALCPNCHRKMEVSRTKEDEKKLQKVLANHRNLG